MNGMEGEANQRIQTQPVKLVSTRGQEVICGKGNSRTTDSPCAISFPAHFVWILLQETKVLSVH